MHYRFVQQASFRIVGYQESVLTEEDGQFHPRLWDTLSDTEYSRLQQLNSGNLSGIVHANVSTAKPVAGESAESVDYYIAVATEQPCPGDLSELYIPAQLWAIFTAEGAMPNALLSTWERVYSEWFPVSGYELASAPEIVREIGNDRYEIWIPVHQR